mmetsp:Transcript_33230/g.75701  ORF Transcript_33230/g.75701 Transcript_33230/m.75701 type:complete len:101 (+) Transcript_33230:82-384(+)
MARRGSSSILALALVALVAFQMVPTSMFVGFRAPMTQSQALKVDSVRTVDSVAMRAAPGGGAGPPSRINLAFLGFFAGMAALGLLAAFFYGSYVGLGSSL